MDQLLAQEVKRWQVVADRRWVLGAEACLVLGSPERLRTGLDTLVENAIRYTSVVDTIRLVGSREAIILTFSRDLIGPRGFGGTSSQLDCL